MNGNRSHGAGNEDGGVGEGIEIMNDIENGTQTQQLSSQGGGAASTSSSSTKTSQKSKSKMKNEPLKKSLFMINEMLAYAENKTKCRRKMILEYFGEKFNEKEEFIKIKIKIRN